MSRVERTDNPSDRSSSSQPRQSLRIRRPSGPERQSSPGRTPNKAEGEVADVEEALERQDE